ncbi:MAG: ChuX/HutX family heme-like substrate-binding protein, partial [Pseudomonadota bacterium]
YARDGTDQAAWDRMLDTLATGDPARSLELIPRKAVEPRRIDARKCDELRRQWAAMTDTLQFLPMTRALGINRLGALHMAGSPFATALAPDCIPTLFEQLVNDDIPLMIFVGNPGCIQIHAGPVHKLRTMGHWFNVMDPRFNLHLRTDRIAEVWRVEKPTRHGPAISIEAFDPDGDLIVQLFGLRKPDLDLRPPFVARVDHLPTLESVA